MPRSHLTVNVEVEVKRCAQELAGLSDLEQAEFFNQFVLALRSMTKDEYHVGLQMASIADLLSPSTKDALKHLTYEEKKGKT